MSGNVYADGTWDLLHYNHMELLRECLNYGDRLVVGVVSDAWVGSYKRPPIMREHERLRAVRALGFVSEAFLLDGPFDAALMERIIDKYDPVAVVYGSPGFDEYYEPAARRGIMKRPSYRAGISTSEIIRRVLEVHGSPHGSHGQPE